MQATRNVEIRPARVMTSPLKTLKVRCLLITGGYENNGRAKQMDYVRA